MKMRSVVLCALASCLVAGTANADRGGHRGGHWHGGGARLGISIGVPFGWYYPSPYYPSPYYPSPYWYDRAPVVVQSAPPVYIEREAAAAEEPYYWYHCSRPEGYYPYIKECPGGWKKVAPTPPPN